MQTEGVQVDCAERETEQGHSSSQRNREPSPLFVPFEAASSEEEDVPLTSGSDQTPAYDDSSSSRVVLSSTQQSQAHPVFEYVQENTIPSEFLLPGEAESTPLVVSQTSLSENDPAVPTIGKVSRSNSPCVPAEAKKPEFKSELGKKENADVGNSFNPQSRPAQTAEEVEIAETPSASLNVFGSERTQDTGTQLSSQPVNFQSNYSSLISQFYSSNGSTPSGNKLFYESSHPGCQLIQIIQKYIQFIRDLLLRTISAH